jgi:hypothetical protein
MYQIENRKLKYFKGTGSKFNGAQAIYTNENLTAYRRRLYTDVRKRLKQNE